MSFNAKEISRDKGEPVSLYLFRFGDGPNDYFGYTSAEKQIVSGGWTFEPKPIKHGRIVASGTMDKTTLEIKTSIKIDLIPGFSDNYSSQVMSIAIYQGHMSDSEFKLAWTGRVLGTRRKNSEAFISCQPGSLLLKRVGLRRNWQLRCPLVLYGLRCSASRDDRTSTFEPVGVAGNLIDMPADWNEHAPKIKYRGGTMKWVTAGGVNEVRTILQVDEDENALLLSAQPTGLFPGMTVEIAPGCNHQMDDCLGIHANIKNFGGDPWIPTKNPFGISNPYY